MIGFKQYVHLTFELTIKEKIKSFLAREMSGRAPMLLQNVESINNLKAKPSTMDPPNLNAYIDSIFKEIQASAAQSMGDTQESLAGDMLLRLEKELINESTPSGISLYDLYSFVAFYIKNPDASITTNAKTRGKYNFTQIFCEIFGEVKYRANYQNQSSFISADIKITEMLKTFVPDNLFRRALGYHPQFGVLMSGGSPWIPFNFEYAYLPYFKDKFVDVNTNKSAGIVEGWATMPATPEVTKDSWAWYKKQSPSRPSNRSLLYDNLAFVFNGNNLFKDSFVKSPLAGKWAHWTFPDSAYAPPGDAYPAGVIPPIYQPDFEVVDWADIIQNGYFVEYFFKVNNTGIVPAKSAFDGNVVSTNGYLIPGSDNVNFPRFDYLSFREIALFFHSIYTYASATGQLTIRELSSDKEKQHDTKKSILGMPSSDYPFTSIIEALSTNMDLEFGARFSIVPKNLQQDVNMPFIQPKKDDIAEYTSSYPPPPKANYKDFDKYNPWQSYVPKATLLRTVISDAMKISKRSNFGAFKSKAYLNYYAYPRLGAPSVQNVGALWQFVEWNVYSANIFPIEEVTVSISAKDIKNIFMELEDRMNGPLKLGPQKLNYAVGVDNIIDKEIIQRYSKDIFNKLMDTDKIKKYLSSSVISPHAPLLSYSAIYYDEVVKNSGASLYTNKGTIDKDVRNTFKDLENRMEQNLITLINQLEGA